MAKVNSDEMQAYIAGTIDPARAREIANQAESDEELAASIWLLRRLYDSDDDIQSFKSECRDVPSSDSARLFVGRYRLNALCGRGSISEVWLGYDPCLCREVAIKILRAEYCGKAEIANQFYRETLISGRLQHPDILPVYECGRLPDHRPFFIMKLVRGHTLAELLATRSTPSDDLQQFVALFKHVCEAVSYAHSKGIIHRDLKPSNVMVGQFGEVQVMDWGLAKVLGGDREESTIDTFKLEEMDTNLRAEQCAVTSASSQVGLVMGTWGYMAPEQARGLACKADKRSDVFGLGAFLCTILTGKPPYVGPTKEEDKRRGSDADLTGAYARLEACGADADLIKLAKRCLAEKPDDRPRDASIVATALTEYVADVEEQAQKSKVAQAVAKEKADAKREARQFAQKATRRMRWSAASAGLLLLALFAAGVFAWREHYSLDGRLAADPNKDNVFGSSTTSTTSTFSPDGSRPALGTWVPTATYKHLEVTLDGAFTAAISGDLDAAEKATEEAERAGAPAGQVQMLRGQIALHRGQSHDARQHLEKAVRLLPDSVAARGMLAAAYASDGDWERYDRMSREMEELTPSTPEDFLFKGYAEANLEPDRGLQTMKQAFDRRPMMGIALLLRAEVRALVAQDTDNLLEAEGAVQDANYAKELLCNNPASLWVSLEAHLAKAGVHEHREEKDQREAELNLAGKDADLLKPFTALPEAVVYRWLYFREVGKAEEVLDELRQASEKTDHVYVTFCYALTLYRRGDFEEALRALENKRGTYTYNDRLLPFVLVEHDHPNKHDWPARAHKAREDFAARSQDGAAIMDMQAVLYLLGKKDDAVKANKALLEQPDRFYTLRREPILRCVQYNAGELTADKLLQEARHSRWDQCLAHYYFAMTKLAEGNREEAKEHFDKVIKTRAFFWGPYDMSWVFQARLDKDRTWPPWISKNPAK
jgi:serine/threonine protein kinase